MRRGGTGRSRTRAAVLALTAALVAAATGTTTAQASSGGAPMLFGLAYGGDWRAELDDFASQQGKAPAFFQIFWDDTVFDEPHIWAGGILSDLHDKGITAWIEWTTTDVQAMANGSQDGRIRNFYAAIDDFLLAGPGRSAVIAPLPEANLDEWGDWCCDPVAYQKAFRRMRVLADEAGLGPEHVRFAFSMNGLSTRGRSYSQFYPGDDHVDLLSFSRLNRGTFHSDGWRDYADTFGFPIGDLREQIGTTKPIMVSQTGAVTSGGDRDAWLRDMFDGLKAEDQVIGAIYFNRDKSADFRIHSKAAGIPLNAAARTGYNTWSPPSAADWLFDGSLDDWVSARGGAPALWPPSSADPPPATNIFSTDLGVTTRVGAATPIANAVAISQARFTADTARHVAISRDDKFPDALAGSPLLGDGPLLLTPTSQLAAAVRAELDRVLPGGGRVYLLGGPGALSTDIEDELRGDGYDVVRLWGSDRFKTAKAIAQEVIALYPQAASTVLVARGFGTPDDESRGWADSVTGGGFAAFSRHPVVLSATHELTSEAADVVQGRSRVVLMGGPGALGDQVLADADAIAGTAQRVSGTARDRTAVAIMTDLWGQPPREFRQILIDGYSQQGWAFGLPAAGLSADFQAPLLPVIPNAIPAGTKEAITSCFSKRIASVVVGTAAIVSDAVLASVEEHDHSC